MPTSRSRDPDNGALRADIGPTVSNGDPTNRTYQQILRENFWLRELLETRLTAIEHAMDLLQSFADRTPTTSDVSHEVQQLREVVLEKFNSVNTTFTQKDAAVRDAFQAQEKQAIATTTSTKEANTKMEDFFTKQIDAAAKTRESDIKGTDDKINDMKDRITVIESKTSVSDPTTAISLAKLEETVRRLSSTGDLGAGNKQGQAIVIAMVISIISLLLGLAGAIGLVFKMIR